MIKRPYVLPGGRARLPVAETVLDGWRWIVERVCAVTSSGYCLGQYAVV